MRRKKRFLTLIFPFLWVILSGFGSPQDQKQVKKTTGVDSINVSLSFENPNLTIRDQRNMDVFEKILQEIENNENAVANAITNTSHDYLSILEKDQERRYESALDYLERMSNHPTSEIEKFIKQRRLSEMLASIVLITSLLLAYGIIIKANNWKTIDWRIFLTRTCGIIIICILLFYTLNSVIYSLFFPESYKFYSLITLSG